jgi:NADH pyrophosphatase NudC (nudix superfamily)
MPADKVTAPTPEQIADGRHPKPGTTTRGHDEQVLSTNMRYCLACGAKKPARGGWAKPCPKAERAFMGGDES